MLPLSPTMVVKRLPGLTYAVKPHFDEHELHSECTRFSSGHSVGLRAPQFEKLT